MYHIYIFLFQEIDALTVNEHIEESNSEAACVSSEIASCSKQKDSEDSKPEDNLPEKSEGNHAEGSKNGKMLFDFNYYVHFISWQYI